jgi:hypothetical protein
LYLYTYVVCMDKSTESSKWHVQTTAVQCWALEEGSGCPDAGTGGMGIPTLGSEKHWMKWNFTKKKFRHVVAKAPLTLPMYVII